MAKTLRKYNHRSGTNHTTSLFHYTQEWKNVLGILENGIYFSYSFDNLGLIFIAIPMISFCDIPLSRNQEHISRYGKYAIGISKDALLNKYPNGYWGPVHYAFNASAVRLALLAKEQLKSKESEFQNFIDNRLENPLTQYEAYFDTEKGKVHLSIDEFMPITEMENTIQNLNKAICYTLGFLKPFDGKNKKGEKQNNYDECEWRIILPERVQLSNGDNLKWIYSQEEYNNWRGDKSSAKPHLQFAPFKFSIDHLRFIIVENDSELAACVKDIMSLSTFCGEPINDDIKAQLCSKIISQEQISKDF